MAQGPPTVVPSELDPWNQFSPLRMSAHPPPCVLPTFLPRMYRSGRAAISHIKAVWLVPSVTSRSLVLGKSLDRTPKASFPAWGGASESSGDLGTIPLLGP